jgi:3-dehydroquinate synthase
MALLQQIVRVEFRYQVHFTQSVFEPGNTILRDLILGAGEGRRKILVVVEEAVNRAFPALIEQVKEYADAHSDAIELTGHPHVIPGGEWIKQTKTYVDRIREAIHQNQICRHSFVMAIGGGALLDAVGYAAATAHRGVRLIRLPTTVLSQNDSGVGVKNSLNLFGKKNFIGTFAPPYAVINDFDFLRSLSDRDFRSGLAEAVKVALIKDAAFFEGLENLAERLNQRDSSAVENVIYRCAELHLQHIAGNDPFELGRSRPLDFGHWAAHKLEQLTEHRLRHGEAVAIGIALDASYSHLIGMLSEASWRRIVDLLLKLGFEIGLSQIKLEDLMVGLDEFREHLGGELTIMLLRAIGVGEEVHTINRKLVEQSAGLLGHYSTPCATEAIDRSAALRA